MQVRKQWCVLAAQMCSSFTHTLYAAQELHALLCFHICCVCSVQLIYGCCTNTTFILHFFISNRYFYYQRLL